MKRALTMIGVTAIMLVGSSCTGGAVSGLVSVDVDGVQSGYVNACNLGSTESHLVMQATHLLQESGIVYVTYTVDGGPGGEGYTAPSLALPLNGGYGAPVFITPFLAPGSCVSATLRDVDGHGVFLYSAWWQRYFTPGG